MFVLPNLPYARDALQPVISGRTMHFHHDKHHAAYVAALNEQLAAEDKRPQTLEHVIIEASKRTDRKMFNNAAQVWNHSFFWTAMSVKRERPVGVLGSAIDGTFGDLSALKRVFVNEGVSHFGSGWVWLVANRSGELRVRSTHDADDTLTHDSLTPLLACDLWEHAYYLDHQNDRKGFLNAWFDALPNWDFAARQFEAAQSRGEPWRHPKPEPVLDLKISKAR